MSPLKIAVVGAGLIGRTHVSVINASDDCELEAIVDPAPQASRLATELNVPWHESIDALLSRTKPDGIIIATPNNLHVSQARQCLKAVVPVLLEKPVAASFAEGQALLGDVQRSGVPVLVGHHRAHGSIMASACEIIASGRLGRLVSVMGSAQFHKPEAYFAEAPWRSVAGGGPILINLIHEVHNLRMLMGEISEVQAVSSNAVRGFAVEDTVAITLRFASGALGTFMLSDTAACARSWEQTSGENPSYASYPEEECYLVVGTRGSLSLPAMQLNCHGDGQEASWWSPFEQRRLNVVKADPLVNQLAHFAQLIRGEAEPLVSILDGLANLQVVEAVAQSASSGHPVKVKSSA